MSTDNIEIWWKWIRRLYGILSILGLIFVIWLVCFGSYAATPDSAGIYNRECWNYGLARDD